MPDAIRGTVELMEAPAENVCVRSAYNFAGVSFSPEEMANEITRNLDGFSIDYAPDFRQEIAASWPQSIDDSVARKDWNWRPQFDLARLTTDMLENIGEQVL